MGKLFFDLLTKIADKVFSARFLITVMIGVTYCHIIAHSVHHYLQSVKDKPEQLEVYISGLMTGFSGLAVFVFKSYFDRADRADEAKPAQATGSVTTAVNPQPEKTNASISIVPDAPKP